MASVTRPHRSTGEPAAAPSPARWWTVPLLLAWVFVVAGASFTRGMPRDDGSGDNRAAWRQVLWLLLLVAGIPGTVLLISTLRRILGGA